MDEQDAAPVDPLENPRADWLGVRTARADKKEQAPILRDRAMERASTEEPLPAVLPLLLKVGAPRDVPEGAAPIAAEVVSAEVYPPSAPQVLEPPQSGEVVALEYVEDPVLAGRPRLGNDGSVRSASHSGGDPTRYGSDPTYPAAYYAEGSAPASVPKNREVWPALRPWHPTLLPRVWRRIHDAVAGSATPAS
jgi:hypothetical protein